MAAREEMERGPAGAAGAAEPSASASGTVVDEERDGAEEAGAEEREGAAEEERGAEAEREERRWEAASRSAMVRATLRMRS
jgi:hypothetical protein